MADVVTGEAVVLDVRAARLASRAVAFGIDLLIQLAAFVVLAFFDGIASQAVDAALIQAITLVLVVLVIVGYPTACESLWRGRSPGKATLGLRVVSEDGGPERFRQALFRALAGFIEIWLLLGSVALIASLASRHGKRLGDIFAGTLVVRERVPVRGGPVPMMPPQLAGWAAGLELARLPDAVAMMARQCVSRYHELAPEVREDMGRRVATAVATHVSPPPPMGTPPFAYLSAVLAERRRREEARLAAQLRPQPYGGGMLGQPSPGTPPPWRSPQPGTQPYGPPAQPDGSPARQWQPPQPYQPEQSPQPTQRQRPEPQPQPPQDPPPPPAAPGGFVPPS